MNFNSENMIKSGDIVTFDKEGKQKLKELWDFCKITNLDFSGWSYNYACKRAKEFNIEVGVAYTFKGFTGDALHNYAEIYYADGDIFDGSRSFSGFIKILEKNLSSNTPKLVVDIIGESNSLEKREEIINFSVKVNI